MDRTEPFDPSRHLTRVGGNDYLEVKWRIAWFRDRNPNGHIETEIVRLDPPLPHPETGEITGFAIFKATVITESGAKSTGHGSEAMSDFRDFVEKGETKAIGRALAAAGYGTQSSDDFSDAPSGRIADSPVQRPPQNQPARPQAQQQRPPAQNAPPTQNGQQRPAQGQPPQNQQKPMATPRQQSYIKALIAEQGENPDDFLDVINIMNIEVAKSWIEQLQVGTLPWLSSATVGVEPPKASAPEKSGDDMIRQVLMLDATKSDQQKHWDHWINAAGNDVDKWRNLANQAIAAVKMGGEPQKWRFNMMAKSAINDDILFGVQAMAEKMGVFNPDLEATIQWRATELVELGLVDEAGNPITDET